MMQTNIKQTYIPPEIIVEEFFDDETLLAANSLGVEGQNGKDFGEGSDSDPKPEDAKSAIWSPDFFTVDEDGDY